MSNYLFFLSIISSTFFCFSSVWAAEIATQCTTSLSRLVGGLSPSEFVPIEMALNQAKKAFSQVETKLSAIETARKARGLAPMTREEAQQAFRKIVYRELNPAGEVGRRRGEGGMQFLDTPAFAQLLSSVKRADGSPLFDTKQDGGGGFGFDHHGPFFDPQDSERNTSMKVLDYIERELEAGKSVGDIARNMRLLTTDNLGDGALAIWIRDHIADISINPKLREFLRQMTHYEDFGVFGTAAEGSLERNPEKHEAIEAAMAMLAGYDGILKKYDGILSAATSTNSRITSDRIFEPGRINLTPEEQAAAIQEAQAVITQALNDPTYRAEMAAQFKAKRAEAMTRVNAAHSALETAWATQLREKGVPPSEQESRMKNFGEKVFYFDSGMVSGLHHGVFAAWAAPAQVHDKPLQLGTYQLPNGRTGFVLAIPQGRQFGKLQVFGDRIRAAHNERVRQGVVKDFQKLATEFMGYAQSETNPVKRAEHEKTARHYQSEQEIEAMIKLQLERQRMAVGGRDALQFSFGGVYLAPTEILDIASQVLSE